MFFEEANSDWCLTLILIQCGKINETEENIWQSIFFGRIKQFSKKN
jgi:hypothetical protein